MTEDHWKQNLLLALLPFLLLSGTLLEECHGQAGTNYFYYYSPTQRTMVNHGLPSGAGQIFGNPFFNQHQQQQQTQHGQQFEQPATQQQQQTQPNFPFPTVPPSFQQSTLLGYNHPQFQRQQQQTPFQNVFPPAPPAQLQYPLVTPTPAQDSQQQELFEQQTQPAFNAFSRFGNNAQLLGRLPQTSQPSFFSTQSPLGTVAPGAFNFFQSPFQFLQQRFMQDAAQPTTAPGVPDLPTPTTTLAPSPTPPPPSPTPTTSPASELMNAPAVQEIVPKRSRISSRFRYVQQPPQPQIRQYNPYSQLGSPYTSDLPYTEQRFYSSPTTPTGYAFSLGGDNAGNGATSTVHFSMGPTNKIKQYLTEITATRQMLQRQRIEQSPAEVTSSVPPMISQDAPAEPMMVRPTTPATTPAPTPQTPEPMPKVEVVSAAVAEPSNSTLEPLLNEPSLQTETIAAPGAAISPEVTRKISETNIPKRLVIRKKVARNRLRLNGSGEVVDSQTPAMAVGVMIRRRILASPNRLPVEEPKQFEDETPKGPAVSSVTTPSTTTTTTTTTEPTLPEQMGVEQHDVDEEETSQEHNMEPQPAAAPSSEEAPIMPHEESQMTVNDMSESQENNNNNNDASNDLRQDSPPSLMSSMTLEENSEAMSKEVDEMKQPPLEHSSTTPVPIQYPPMEGPEDGAPLMPENQPEQPIKHEDNEEYYYEEEPTQSHPMSNGDAPSQVMTAVMAPESSDELPILNGVQTEDYPGVFHPDSSPFDNSVETDQGEVITRITSSHPSSEQESVEMVAPPAIPSPPSMMITSSTTTTEATPPEFTREDPAEEQPPMDSEEPVAPVFQPTTTTTTEATPMMTTTPDSTMMMSSTAHPSESAENAEIGSAEEHDEESNAASMPVQENNDESSSNELSSSSSTTEQPEDPMPPMDDMSVSSTTESVARAPETIDEPMNANSTAEATVSSSTHDDLPVMPEVEMLGLSVEEETSASSSTTMAPPSATTEATSSEEQVITVDVSVSKSQEEPDSIEIPSSSQEMPTDSEEIGKAQRLALEETLRRLRERQQTTSTGQPQDQLEESPENEVQTGRRVFMRKPIVVTNLPLPTSRPISNINAVLDEEEGLDRSKVLQKIIRFRTTTTTTKRPRRVTRPSLSTDRHLAVVEPVEDLLEDQEQVDSFSDSSSTPGTTAQPATTTPPTPKFSRSRTRTTPSTSSTTVIPEESSTTPPTITDDEMTYQIHTTSSTATYTTTPLPPMLTHFSDESSSTTESIMAMVDEMSSTTEIDFEPITTRGERDMTGTTFSSTTTTEATMMTTTTPAPIEAMTTTPSTTTYSSMTDFFSDEKDDLSKNDDDIFYEENPANIQDVQVISSTEVSTEADVESHNTSSTTTTTPPSTTDSIYAYLTTVEPISGSATTTSYENDQSSTTIDPEVSSSTTISPDISSSQTTATTPAGQLIIHEILPTMPPLHEVSFVIGDSVEDDQSSAIDTSSANESDELLAADKAVVRVEAKVHISTNSTDIEGLSGEQQSQESQELTQPRMFNSRESGESGQRRVVKKVVKIKKSRRLRRPEGGSGNEDGRRRRRKVFNRRPQ